MLSDILNQTNYDKEAQKINNIIYKYYETFPRYSPRIK